MASGFYDLLAWLLGWKSQSAATSGPPAAYRVETGDVRHTGTSSGEQLVHGAAMGQVFNTGQATGQIDGRCG